jgi:hypothetical protein
MSVRRTLAALSAVLLLAGCAGDPKPKVEQAPTMPATSPTDSTPLTAREFVNHWVDVANDMQTTGETDEYRLLSSDCEPCIETAKRVEHVYSEGGHIETAGWDVKRTKLIDNGTTTDVDLWVVSSPTVIVHGDGGRERLRGGPNHFVLSIARRGHVWVAQSLAVYSQ